MIENDVRWLFQLSYAPIIVLAGCCREKDESVERGRAFSKPFCSRSHHEWWKSAQHRHASVSSNDVDGVNLIVECVLAVWCVCDHLTCLWRDDTMFPKLWQLLLSCFNICTCCNATLWPSCSICSGQDKAHYMQLTAKPCAYSLLKLVQVSLPMLWAVAWPWLSSLVWSFSPTEEELFF